MGNDEMISTPYPSGSICFSFNMHVDHRDIISCQVNHPSVKNVLFEKINSNDEFDPQWLMKIILGKVTSINEVDEIGLSIKEDILDVLCFSFETKVSKAELASHSLTPRKGEGAIMCCILPALQFSATIRSGGMKLNDKKLSKIQDQVLNIDTSKKKSLFRVFRYATCTNEPIVQFLMFYLILYEIHGNQREVDQYIMEICPNTIRSPSPHNNRKLETIFTRLRNEITHRTNLSPVTTRNEVINNLDSFKQITQKAIQCM